MSVSIEPLYYHTIDLPDGLHQGVWDCREVMDAYLGRLQFADKTVLEVGPANGLFTYAMEARGAKVVCLDLGSKARWDFVPGPLICQESLERAARVTLERIEAAFWHGHQLTRSCAEMRYGTIYDAPKLVGQCQIGMLGNVLQHLRDPIGGLMAIADRVAETLIITESLWIEDPRILDECFMQLIPRADLPDVCQSWWQVSVALIGETLKMLGFPHLRTEFHYPTLQAPECRAVRHVTCVGSR